MPPKLTRDLADYVATLKAAFPAIESIWWIGSRANPTSPRRPRPDSDWDLVAFADRATLDALRARSELHRDDVDLLVVFDGEHYVKPFDAAAEERLWSAWNWTQLNDNRASYETSYWPEADAEPGEAWADLTLMGWRVA